MTKLRRTVALVAGTLIFAGLVWLIFVHGADPAAWFTTIREYRPLWVLCPIENRYPPTECPLPGSTGYPEGLFPRGAVLAVEWSELPGTKANAGSRPRGSPAHPESLAAYRIESDGGTWRQVPFCSRPLLGLYDPEVSSNPDAVYSRTGWTCVGPPSWVRIKLADGVIERLRNYVSIHPFPQGLACLSQANPAGDNLYDSTGAPHALGLTVQETCFTTDSMIVVGIPPDSLKTIQPTVRGGPVYLAVFSRGGGAGRRTRIGVSGLVHSAVVRPDGAIAFSVFEGEERSTMVVAFPDGAIVTRTGKRSERFTTFLGSLLCSVDDRNATLFTARSLQALSRLHPKWARVGFGGVHPAVAVLLSGERVVLSGPGRDLKAGSGPWMRALGVFDFGGRPRGKFLDLPGSTNPGRFQVGQPVSLELFEPGWLLISIGQLGLALYDVRE